MPDTSLTPILQFPVGDVFIETGLGHGGTASAALLEPYLEVHSIEIDPALIERRRRVAADPRHHLHLGSSVELLLGLCNPARRTVFWLDAHYSKGDFTGSPDHDRTVLDRTHGECPLLAELAIIRAVPWRVPPIILIDDIICFTLENYVGTYADGITRAQWPREAEIRAALPPNYIMTVCGDGRYWQAVSATEDANAVEAEEPMSWPARPLPESDHRGVV